MAVTTSDADGFREIQLNGKQLVFLFMAVTVVLVVTFLTGVLVGRGVRAERAEAAQAESLTETPPTPTRVPELNPQAEDPTKALPPPAATEETIEAVPRNPSENGTVANRSAVESAKVEPAPAKPAVASPAKAPAPVAKAPATTAAAPAPAPATSVAANAPVASAPPSGPRNGYAVQVAAVAVRGDADSIVRRLSAKGYSAYVEVPKSNGSMFRVRVGTFRTRREAQGMADRLKKEEKFKPWVTR